MIDAKLPSALTLHVAVGFAIGELVAPLPVLAQSVSCVNSGAPVTCLTDNQSWTTIDTSGGAGSDSNDNDDAGGTGSTGGTALISNPAGSTSAFALYAVSYGGAGGTGAPAGEDGGHFFNGPSAGGAGGQGGTATVTNDGVVSIPNISATASRAALNALVDGGAGGASGNGSGLNGGQAGGAGGDGGTASRTNGGQITTVVDYAAGIFVHAGGGAGGAGGGAGDFSSAGNSGAGGNGGSATGTNNAGATISTSGSYSAALLIQADGGAGADGIGSGNLDSSGNAGSGGNGGTTQASNAGSLTVTGDTSGGIWATAVGAAGGSGASNGNQGSAAGNGGNGGTVTAQNSGTVSTAGTWSYGVGITSAGGAGGAGGTSDFEGETGFGGNGGNGGAGGSSTISINAGSSITATGANSFGVYADANGGAGGAGGTGMTTPGNSGNGGSAGTVLIDAVGSVKTSGSNAAGIIAFSNGGAGGTTSSGNGQTGGAGGAGYYAAVTFGTSQEAQASVTTSGSGSPGVAASGTGGAGGDGSLPSTFNTGKGSGGAGGYGAGANVTTYGGTSITTSGSNSPGVSVYSSGGAGGDGADQSGVANGSDGSAGNGGDGGTGGIVGAVSASTIITSGTNSDGLYVASFGGNGGDGGVSNEWVNADGGSGGSGGSNVSWNFSVDPYIAAATNNGSISTSGPQSSGIDVESWGGTGGTGGGANGLVYTTGGNAGNGGTAGDVLGVNNGTINTSGDESYGIFGVSVGGGGANGGNTSAGGLITISTGGNASGGGDGNAVVLTNAGTILTSGDTAAGIFGESIGGGGGNGGTVASYSGSFAIPSVSVSIGGTAGNGGGAGDVTLTNNGALTTLGLNAYGMEALSVGGGGGAGGGASSTSYSAGYGDIPSISVAVAIGGTGGTGGDGGTIAVTNGGTVATAGDQSMAIAAYSIGGGGGDGANAATQTYTFGTAPEISVGASVGGTGGSGGTGGAITIANTGNLFTAGFAADAVYALSVGGGGGNGGTGTAQSSTSLPFSNDLKYIPVSFGTSLSANVSVGGGGGSGNTGGNIVVTNTANISTYGVDSRGVFAQSIGGGGGIAASGNSSGASKFTVNVAVGGTGGTGGDGGTVTLTNSGGAIATAADGAHGIHTQSIGGGGGSGGTASADSGGLQVESVLKYVGVNEAKIIAQSLSKQISTLLNAVSSKYGPSLVSKLEKSTTPNWTPSISASVAIGGNGGLSGDGGVVETTNGAVIATGGDVAFGIFAQSVGGGGGNGGAATIAGGNVINTGVAVGGSGGASGDGNTVTVTNNGQITTAGNAAFGIAAQSGGGGGGLGALGLNDSIFSLNAMLTLGGSSGTSGNPSGQGDTVTVTNAGSIMTSGSESHGIVAQSLGAGGGLALLNPGGTTSPSDDPDVQAILQDLASQVSNLSDVAAAYQQALSSASGTVALNLGGSSSASGDGGPAIVNASGLISTSGDNAFGIVAQSLGGGGGLAADGAGLDMSLAVSGTLGGGSGDGGKTAVTLTSGSIATTGIGSVGIFAQSIGGGGGYTGAFAASGTDYQTFLSNGSVSDGVGGAVTVTTASGTSITTTGANAHGIFAQSLDGGGGAVGSSNGIEIPGAWGNAGRAGSNASTSLPGVITLDLSGIISATGANSVGVHAQSGTQGTSGAIISPQSSNGNISITTSGTLSGGSGTGAAINIDGGNVNTVTIARGGAVSALSGTAIVGSLGSEAVTNHGTLSGSLLLGGGGNALGNYGTFNAGAIVDLGGGALTNAGILNPGGAGNIATTAVNGTFAQAGAGIYAPDIDAGTGASDLLVVSGNAAVAGTIAPVVTDPLPGKSFMVLQSTGGTVDASAAQVSSGQAVYSFSLVPAASSLSVGLDANFLPASASLNPKQTQVAQHIQSLWSGNATDPASAALYDSLAGVTSGAALGTALNSLSSQAGQGASAGAVTQTQQFADTMHSCPTFAESGAKLNESDCVWQRTLGHFTTQDATVDAGGYTFRSAVAQFGGQKMIAPGWILGLSGAYTLSRSKDDTGQATSKGQGFLLGGVLKREIDDWTLSTALHAGMSWHDNSRSTSINGRPEEATSTTRVQHVGGRLRAAYQMEMDGWYLKPYADIDVVYSHVPGFSESGLGAHGIKTLPSDQVTVSGSPNLELGGRIDLEGMRVRPFLSVGLTVLSDGTQTVEQRFVSSPAWTPSWHSTTTSADRLGKVNVGVDLAHVSGFDLKGEYGVRFASGYTSQTGSLRLSYRY